MASVEKIDNAIDRLLFLKGLAMQSDFYLVDGWSVEEAFKEVSEVLHSVEAERPKPVGHFYNRPREGRVGVEWCCDHLDDGAALYAEPVGVEAEKEPEWTPESERHLEQQLTLLARLENSEARISELESLVRQYHVALSGAPGTSPCNCMTESSRPEDHQKICPVSVLSRPEPPEHKPE